MADKFDPYREALVLETETVWGEGLADLDEVEKLRISQALHADASSCTQLEYIRLYTGFCRRITVTQEDAARIGTNA